MNTFQASNAFFVSMTFESGLKGIPRGCPIGKRAHLNVLKTEVALWRIQTNVLVLWKAHLQTYLGHRRPNSAPPQNRCTVSTCACQVSPDKAQYILCVVWMSEWCLLIGSLFTLGFIFRAFPLSQSTNILENAVGPSVPASHIKLKCLRQICLQVRMFWQRQCLMVMVNWKWCQRLICGSWCVMHIDISSEHQSLSFRVFWDVWYFSCAL